MDDYDGLNPVAGTFTPAGNSAYQERVTFDPNGNILTYLRNGDAARLSMDNLSYNYKTGTNQLNKVTDAAADATTNYSSYDDIKQGKASNDYQYDDIGNLVSDASESITNINWNVYGKITAISKSGTVINYVYDASGNRIMKLTSSDTTVYVRDASGNVMSVYLKKIGQSISQSEVHLYGNSRLGMTTQHLALDTSVVLLGGFGNGIKSSYTREEKIFELTNHLGNVLVTIADRRIQKSTGGINVDYFSADVLTSSDYYPFGMAESGRTFTASNTYRYGFNGKENDNGVKGQSNQQDYGMRISDPRLGRFLSVDPLTKSYPELTPYQFASNTPIQAIDLDGEESKLVTIYHSAANGKPFLTTVNDDNNVLNKIISTTTTIYKYAFSTREGTVYRQVGPVIMDIILCEYNCVYPLIDESNVLQKPTRYFPIKFLKASIINVSYV